MPAARAACGALAAAARGGPGSSLSFVIRLEVATPGAAAEAEEGESAALPARLRVLVTDDSRLNRQLLSHALKFISPGGM